MREILARAKIKSENDMRNGEWVAGYFVHLYDHEGNESYRIYTGYAETDCGDYYPDWYEIDPDTVGQFTGPTDMNEKQIFEGDILESRSSEDKRDWKRWVVSFEDGAFVASCKELYPTARKRRRKMEIVDLCKDEISLYGFVVIGNTYDNPELMKEAEHGKADSV